MTVTCSPLSSDPSFPSAGIGLDVFGHDRNCLPSPMASDDDDSDDEDEDEYNVRVAPHWQAYRHLFESRGYHLDTCKDVRQFYLRYWETGDLQCGIQSCAGYRSASREGRDDNELCKDEGLYLTTAGLLAAILVLGSAVQALLLNYDGDKLISVPFPAHISHPHSSYRLLQPERLFRGKRLLDDLPIVIKAVHRQSRELEVITALSTPPLRGDPMNHCIPVLDIIHAPHASYPEDRNQLSFIVMEEWSSQFIPPGQPHTLRSHLNSLRHCIQHTAFMHTHCFAHLDISVRNILTDYDGRYASIDYETSRRFCRPPVEVEEGGDSRTSVLIHQLRAAEIPPEVEKGYPTSPYAWDVWALGVLMSKAGASTGYDVPELGSVTKKMLEPQWERRPSARTVLRRFEKAIMNIPEERLNSIPHPPSTVPAVSS